MNSLLSLVTIVAGFAGAVALLLAGSRRGLLQTFGPSPAKSPGPSRKTVAAALLRAVVVARGGDTTAAAQLIRERLGVDPDEAPIEVGAWAERYAAMSDAQERARLLELAIEVAILREGPIPEKQYGVLLDLAFGLGFQTDALARLRSRYGFEYVDHARASRPRFAQRARAAGDASISARARALSALGLSAGATRHDIVSAYRRLASQYHPDHLADASDEAKLESAERFIELTAAYESLLRIFPND